MSKRLRLLGSIIILVMILAVMYTSNVGIPGIVKYWPDFKLLDMQFLYSIDTVTIMMDKLGEAGIKHYLYYFVVDFTFIITLLFVQLELSKQLFLNDLKKQKLINSFAIGRCIFDILEDIMLTVVLKKFIPIALTPAASFFTAAKFICLIGWCMILAGEVLKKKIAK